MFVGITNTPRDYAWGSHTAIASQLGRSPSGKPEAELWLGAHPGSPTQIIDPAAEGVDGAADLVEWIAAAPETALGPELARTSMFIGTGRSGMGQLGTGQLGTGQSGTGADGAPIDTAARLPFLLKVLAAGGPLSLQAHPSPERARAGFDFENEAGVPLHAPDRNYKDRYHKPELIFALSDTFEALCGFRDPVEVRKIIAELRAIDVSTDDPQPAALDALENRLTGTDPLHDVVDWLLRDGRGGDSGEVSWLVERVVALAAHAEFLAGGGAALSFTKEFATVRSLAASYPGDPGIVISLLTNRVTLRRGEVLYLPAGNIHAYLSGLGIELMAASDNVLRGGLTPKHIDVDELLEVLDFTPLPVPYLKPITSPDAPGVSVFRPDVPDFELVHIETDAAGAASGATGAGRLADAGDGEGGLAGASGGEGGVSGGASSEAPVMRQFTLTGPAIALCTAGGFLVAGAASSVALRRGQSVFITPDEGTLTFAGAGEVFLATTGVAQA